MEKVDIAIIGGGLNGLIAALALAGPNAQRPVTVAIIDKVDPATFASNSHDSRASALTLATQNMFDVLGLWEQVKSEAQPMQRIIVTDGKMDGARPSLLCFATEDGQKPAAALIENYHLFAAALKLIAASPAIKIYAGQALEDISFGPGLAQVKLANGISIKANLVIGADGRNSVSRQKAGLTFEGWDYPQSAITLTVKHSEPHGGLAEEHFTPNGVFAILPLTENRSSLVWTEPHPEARRLNALPDDAFLLELKKRFGDHRGPLSIMGSRHLFPLSLKLANSTIAPRLALIGDAAHVVHPLAGLGLNLGFKDAACLADCIGDGLQVGADIGSLPILQCYEAARRFDTVTTAFLIDGLNRLFANDVPPIKLIRDWGLQIVDRVPAVKALLMKEAAGQTGELPRLMRGLVA